jgi:hypothetical protein
MTSTLIDIVPAKDIGTFTQAPGATLPVGVDVRVTYDDTQDKDVLRHELLRGLRQILAWGRVALFDTFTDPDDTLITAHSPDVSTSGGAWVLTTTDNTTPPANSVVITGNAMNINANARGAVIKSGFPNVAVEVDVLFRTGSRFGVVVRHESNATMMVCRVRGPEAVAELIELATGTITTVGASEPITLVDNTVYRFRAVAVGDTISLFQDGVELFTRNWPSSLPTADDQGIVAFGGTLTNRYDNFTVYALQ